MSRTNHGNQLQPKLRRLAIAIGIISAFVTAFAVSWHTPDGNLVVTLVPALAVGLAVSWFVHFSNGYKYIRQIRISTFHGSRRCSIGQGNGDALPPAGWSVICSSSEQTDPKGPDSGDYRISRGSYQALLFTRLTQFRPGAKMTEIFLGRSS